tara:strand:- start:4257 stop:4502 length:246 start_codon:yes stop_codon:yes gene_type:complete
LVTGEPGNASTGYLKPSSNRLVVSPAVGDDAPTITAGFTADTKAKEYGALGPVSDTPCGPDGGRVFPPIENGVSVDKILDI